jgi:LDH2 family malate/lactate/ureidoglycolate dehydrogenase
VLVPGEIERTLRDRRMKEGIPLAPALIEELGRIAHELNVEPLQLEITNVGER